jgi:hypothetical protein
LLDERLLEQLRELRELQRRLAASPHWKADQEAHRRARLLDPPATPQRKKRKPGGGRSMVLKPDQIERGRNLLREALPGNPKLRRHAAAEKHLRSQMQLGKVAEVLAACTEARNKINEAMGTPEGIVDYTRRCDALLLSFDREAWAKPYALPRYRPILARMLELHAFYGPDSDNTQAEEDAFQELVEAEQAKLEIAAPAEEPDPKPVKLAACATRAPAKRTKSKPGSA